MSFARLGLRAALLLVLAASVRGETFSDAVNRATAEYARRLQAASSELNAARERIGNEKAPLLEQLRKAEDRIVGADAQIGRMQATADEAADTRRRLLLDIEALRKTSAYLATLAHEDLTAFGDGLPPGEGQRLNDPIDALSRQLEAGQSEGTAAVAVTEFLESELEGELGGHAQRGESLFAGDSRVFKGTFAYVGPETFFTSDEGGRAGTVRARSGSALPVTYALPTWKADQAAAFFGGKDAAIPSDPSGGKALKLQEARGSLLAHIQKGGVVAYVIIATGLLAAVMILQKALDLRRLSPGDPDAVGATIRTVAEGAWAKAEQQAKSLAPTVRELFLVGLENADSRKEILEEHLQAVLLRQRLHFERRLPLLAVIATAAPLMGLLGTVVGMVRTFALITVFGTGNAAKLASGISEVLVATELGLVVAIPTLILHGFLSQRIQKNLSGLERYALEFVTAVSMAKEKDKAVPV